ncbi:MAG TPA: twin-arginine translocation signal domain-containing protein, partial [Kaistia sp.]|nr:twin-arginine translocation signal domain-containing protein [Kaistia sp.]
MSDKTKSGISRRTLLKGSAITAGFLGTTAVTGFPAVHADEPITLRYLSTATNQSPAIAAKAKEITGINIEYVTVTTDDVTKRIITQPDSFDLVDTEYFSLRNLIPSGNFQAIDAKKVKLVDKLATAITKGEIDGKKIGDQG